MSVRGFKPIEITPAMVVESSLFETAPATYAAGTTYPLGAFASVAGLLGEILIYKSLQAGNIGHTPASSSTWWVYSSSTYGVFVRGVTPNALGYRVLDVATHSIYEAVTENSSNQPIDPFANPVWLPVKVPVPAIPANWNAGTTYAAGALVYAEEQGVNLGVPTILDAGVWVSVAGGNIGNFPPITGAWNPVPAYPTLHVRECSYPIGQIVKDAAGNTYKALLANNINCPLDNHLLWQRIGPSNRTACFDGETDTQSIVTGEMSFTINAGICDSVALIGCSGGVAYVTGRDGLGGAIVYDEAQGISGNIVADWWAFTYGDATFPLKKAVFTDIPPFPNMHLTIKIVGDAEVKLGTVDIGSMQDLGIGAQYGASVEIKNFGYKNTDSFGKTTLVKKGFKEVLDVQILIDKSEYLRVYNIFTDLRDTPWLIQVSDDPDWGQCLTQHGFYNTFHPVIEYPTHAIYSLQFESLVTS